MKQAYHKHVIPQVFLGHLFAELNHVDHLIKLLVAKKYPLCTQCPEMILNKIEKTFNKTYAG